MSDSLPAKSNAITPDAWGGLRAATSARIALGRAGASLPTHEWLDFKASHAAARDAVHNEFDAEQLAGQIAALGMQTLLAASAAGDRAAFLKRPDLGRRLDPPSQQLLEGFVAPPDRADLAIVVSDGLSALAAHRQTIPLLSALLPKLRGEGWRLAPIVVVRFGRVALEDQIGALLDAQVALMLLGERPGLGSADSLGAYLVYDPKPGNADAQRNCVSNIRPEGLAPADAAETIFYLLSEARRQRLSGVRLKDQRLLQ